MNETLLADPCSANKHAEPSQPALRRRSSGRVARFASLAASGPVLMMTAQFGRSRVRDAAHHFCERHSDLNLKPSWHLFSSLADWGERWPAMQNAFAAGLILSAPGDPVVERAVGRCLADSARLDRPLFWGISGHCIRWRPRFELTRNGWSPREMFPNPFEYARLAATSNVPDFHPQFDPILYSQEPDFSVSGSRLYWHEKRHFHRVMHNGSLIVCWGFNPNDWAE